MGKRTIYLAGGIEKRRDGGVTWRRLITPFLEHAGFIVLNPCEGEDNILSEFNLTPESVRKLDKSTNKDLFMKLGQRFIAKDLAMIERSSIVIVFFDKSVIKSSGTLSEMTIAKYLNKPVYVIKYLPFKKIPVWTMGCVTEFFRDMDECVVHLRKKYGRSK